MIGLERLVEGILYLRKFTLLLRKVNIHNLALPCLNHWGFHPGFHYMIMMAAIFVIHRQTKESVRYIAFAPLKFS